jgi:hypothetical protein
LAASRSIALDSVTEKLVPVSYSDVIESAWFELKDLYEKFFHAGPEFDTYAGDQLDLFESGQECDFRQSLRDRLTFGVPDRIHPKGAFFLALAAAYSSEAQKRLGNTEVAWAYAASSMYWIGHARLAVQIDTLRGEDRSVQTRKAAKSKNLDQWAFIERQARDMLARRLVNAPPLPASSAAKTVHDKLVASALFGRPLSYNRIYQRLSEWPEFAVKSSRGKS